MQSVRRVVGTGQEMSSFALGSSTDSFSSLWEERDFWCLCRQWESVSLQKVTKEASSHWFIQTWRQWETDVVALSCMLSFRQDTRSEISKFCIHLRKDSQCPNLGDILAPVWNVTSTVSVQVTDFPFLQRGKCNSSSVSLMMEMEMHLFETAFLGRAWWAARCGSCPRFLLDAHETPSEQQ